MGVSRGYLSMGPVIRYVRLNPALARKPWNEGLKVGCRKSHGRMHKMCFDNCHTFVADCLNDMEYRGQTSWNSVKLGAVVFFCGSYTSVSVLLLHWITYVSPNHLFEIDKVEQGLWHNTFSPFFKRKKYILLCSRDPVLVTYLFK